MSATTAGAPSTAPAAPRERELPHGGSARRYQAFALLRHRLHRRADLFGLDKFVNMHGRLADLPRRLDQRRRAGQRQRRHVRRRRGRDRRRLAVALTPRFGAYVVAAWLAGIIVNLLTSPATTTSPCATSASMLGALTPWRLATVYDR